MKEEIRTYRHILLGREEMPINNGVMTLMEVAVAMYSRASEMAAEILRGEEEGTVLPKSSLYKFRTGELRQFLAMADKQIELGSRRVTAAKMLMEERA